MGLKVKLENTTFYRFARVAQAAFFTFEPGKYLSRNVCDLGNYNSAIVEKDDLVNPPKEEIVKELRKILRETNNLNSTYSSISMQPETVVIC